MKRIYLYLILFIALILFITFPPNYNTTCGNKIINVTEKDFNYTSFPPEYKIITNETTYTASLNTMQNLKIGLNSCFICNNEIKG